LRLKTNGSGPTIFRVKNTYVLNPENGTIHFLTLKMVQIVSPETLVFNLNQKPGNYPKENNF
jgi:hypothetical protein